MKKYHYFLIGVLFLSIIILIGVMSYYYYQDTQLEIQDVEITNLTDSGASISWYTSDPEVAKVKVKEVDGDWLGEVFYDDRDVEQDTESGEYVLNESGLKERYTHHVSLRGLSPETKYEFYIAATLINLHQDVDEASFPILETMAVFENLSTPDPVYGSVLNIDSTKSPSADGVVYYELYTPGDLQIQSRTYSATLNDNASWSGDLSGIMTVNGDDFISTDNTVIRVKAVTDQGVAESNYSLDEYKPLPILFIEEGEQLSSRLVNGLVSTASADEQCGSDACEAGGGCFPNGYVAENTSTSTEDAIGTYVCAGGNWQQISDEITQDPDQYDSTLESCTRGMERCEEKYTETCNKDGKIGTRDCRKVGESPCGITGPQCSWGPESKCEDCKVGDTSPITLNEDAEAILSQYPNEETVQGNVASGSASSNQTLKDRILNLYADIKAAAGSNEDTCEADGVEYRKGCTFCKEVSGLAPLDDGSGDSVPDSGSEAGAYYHTITESCGEQNTGNPCELGNYPKSWCEKIEGDTRDIGDDGVVPITDPEPSTDESSSVQVAAIVAPDRGYAEVKAGPGDTYPTTCTINDREQVEYSGGQSNNYVLVDYNDSCSGWVHSSKLGVISQSSRFASVLGKVKAQSDSSTALETTVSGSYSVYYGDNFEQPISEFAVNLDGADKAEVRLFVDENSNGVYDKGEQVLDDYSQIKIKKESEVATYHLDAGWNIISVPLISNEGISTASELLEHFNSQGADIKHIAKYTDSGFEMYTQRENDQEFSNDFNIVPGQGYFVLNYTPKSVVIEGNKFDESVPIKVRNGWNLVGIYTNEQAYTGEQLLKDMNEEGIVASIISNYEAGRYSSLVYENDVVYGNDYNLYEREGYFIRVDSGGGDDVRFAPLD